MITWNPMPQLSQLTIAGWIGQFGGDSTDDGGFGFASATPNITFNFQASLPIQILVRYTDPKTKQLVSCLGCGPTCEAQPLPG
jgi:hypothetical protein